MSQNIKSGYLRVTQVLSIFSGLSEINAEVLKNACDRGKLVHDTIEAIRIGIGVSSIPEYIEGYMNSYKLWSQGKEFIDKPKRMYCDDLMITGEVDDIYKDGS